MISSEEIKRIHSSVWIKGYGSITANECCFLRDVIAKRQPGRFLELGTASGLSTGFIAEFMSHHGGQEVVSIDLAPYFWIDQSKSIGFLARQIYTGNDVKIVFHQGKDSSCLAENNYSDKFDMAFIDANHQHPWPTLDMIAVLPALNKRAIIVHHDLALYRKQTPLRSIGPKYLYDQIKEDFKVLTNDPKKNIFYIKTTSQYFDFEESLVNALYLPWSNRLPITDPVLKRFREIIDQYWGADLLKAFDESTNKFNRRQNALKLEFMLTKQKLKQIAFRRRNMTSLIAPLRSIFR